MRKNPRPLHLAKDTLHRLEVRLDDLAAAPGGAYPATVSIDFSCPCPTLSCRAGGC